MATQLEKQLRVPSGKYSTAQLARLKSAKDDGDFSKIKKLMDSRMEKASENKKPKAKKSEPKKSSPAKKVTKKKSGPTQGKAPTTSKSSVSVSKRKDSSPSRTSPNKPAKAKTPAKNKSRTSNVSLPKNIDKEVNRFTPSKLNINVETVSQRDRPSSKRMGSKYTYAQWKKMTRVERKNNNLPLSEIGAQTYFNIKGKG